MNFKNAQEVLKDYYGGAIKYEATKHDLLKWQISGAAFIYISKFIDWCFIKNNGE